MKETEKENDEISLSYPRGNYREQMQKLMDVHKQSILDVLIIDVNSTDNQNEFLEQIVSFRINEGKNKNRVRIIIFCPDRKPGDPLLKELLSKQVFDFCNPELKENKEEISGSDEDFQDLEKSVIKDLESFNIREKMKNSLQDILFGEPGNYYTAQAFDFIKEEKEKFSLKSLRTTIFGKKEELREKIVYVDREVPVEVEREVIRDRVVEKPVEKVVYQDRIIEKEKEVEKIIEKIEREVIGTISIAVANVGGVDGFQTCLEIATLLSKMHFKTAIIEVNQNDDLAQLIEYSKLVKPSTSKGVAASLNDVDLYPFVENNLSKVNMKKYKAVIFYYNDFYSLFNLKNSIDSVSKHQFAISNLKILNLRLNDWGLKDVERFFSSFDDLLKEDEENIRILCSGQQNVFKTIQKEIRKNKIGNPMYFHKQGESDPFNLNDEAKTVFEQILKDYIPNKFLLKNKSSKSFLGFRFSWGKNNGEEEGKVG
jgi:hypothetical protein